MTRKHTFYVLGFALLALIAPVTYQIDRAAQSLPKLDGEVRLPGLAAPVAVEFDNLAIPTVTAQNREDAHRALGLLHARDRLFQMDLMR
ncbi:penicillin acylase family protein, partial [Methylomagnum sp.]